MALCLFLGARAGYAQSPQHSAAAAAQSVPILPLAEVRAGQRGHGLSVWSGSVPESFDFEVLGVMRNSSPDTSYILARLTGKDLERSGVIAGMSGSPVYIDGKLIGAVSFGWNFSQDAIAGITPIEAMRALSTLPLGTRSPAPPSPDVTPVAEQVRALVSGLASKELLRQRLAVLRPAVSVMGNATTSGVLFAASGFGETSLGLLREALGGIAAAGEAPAGSATDLVPGGAVAAILVDGDLRIAATGTVTDRVGDEVLVFGHPFFGGGPIRLPMAPAEVVTVVSSRMSSFKIANFGAPVGAFDQDRAAGMRGRIGLEAPMVPLTVAVGERTFHMRLADVPALLPQMLAVSALGALDAAGHATGPQSLTLDARLKLRRYGEVRLVQDFDGDTAGMESALYLLAVGNFLAQNRLADVVLDEVHLKLSTREGAQSATILAAHADHAVVRPGERVAIGLELQAYRGANFQHALEVVVPRDVPNGRYSLLIGDGGTIDAARLMLEGAAPETFEQVLALLATLHSRRDIVVLGYSPAKGLEVSGQAMPKLPGTLRAVWGAAGSWSASPLRFAVAQQDVDRIDVPALGSVRVELEVRRRETLGPSGQPVPQRPAAPAAGAVPNAKASPASKSSGLREDRR